MNENSSNFTVIGVDVISYSLRELPDQVQAQNILDRSLETAVGTCWKWERSDVHWIDAGDGGFLLLTGHEHAALDIIDSINSCVAEDIRKWPDTDKVHLRYAIHCDRIRVWDGKFGRKFTGNALNNCARLLNDMNKEQKGQVICSGDYYKAISAFGNATVNSQRLYDIVDKHGITHSRYNMYRSPGFGVRALEREIHPDPTFR